MSLVVDQLFATLASASERIDLIHSLVNQERTIVIWDQLDPAWKDVPIGSTTMGKFGCLITSWAMMLSLTEARDVQPIEVKERLSSRIHSNGGVMYEDLTNVYKNVTYDGYHTLNGNTPKQLLEIANEADMKTWFRTIGLIVPTGTHYVLAIGENRIADPIGGVVIDLKDRYKVEQIFEVAMWRVSSA